MQSAIVYLLYLSYLVLNSLGESLSLCENQVFGCMHTTPSINGFVARTTALKRFVWKNVDLYRSALTGATKPHMGGGCAWGELQEPRHLSAEEMCRPTKTGTAAVLPSFTPYPPPQRTAHSELSTNSLFTKLSESLHRADLR